MKTIEMTDEQYLELLKLKNYVSTKVGTISNDKVLDKIKPSFINKDSTKAIAILPSGVETEYDFEPEYSFGKCIAEMVKVIMTEQATGEVIPIT